MSQYARQMMRKSVLLLCFLVLIATSRTLTAQKPRTQTDPASVAAALVTKQYSVNPNVLVPGTQKPLPKNGTVGVRPAQADERIADCESADTVCLEVVYRAGQPEIACGWTVLLPSGGGLPKVVNLNDAAAQYMLRMFGLKDVDRPKFVGVMPVTPPIMKVAHQMGFAIVRVVVDRTGKVVGTAIVDYTNAMMNQGAIDAPKGWQFDVFTVNGRALPYEEQVSFHVMVDMGRYVSP